MPTVHRLPTRIAPTPDGQALQADPEGRILEGRGSVDLSPHPFLEHDGLLAFAHRGGSSAAPENTLEAFDDAVRLGYSYVETDVHVTADGKVVAFHDPDLKRTCGIDGRIEQLEWSDVKAARVDDRAAIPLLDEVLSSWPALKVNIDCKADSALAPLVEVLRRHRCLDRVCLGSFSDRRLDRLRSELGPDLCTSLGPRGVARLMAASVAGPKFAGGLPAMAAQIPVKQGPLAVTTRRLVETAHRLGLHVHVWTIDDPAEMETLIDLGVDGIMTDDCRTLKSVLVGRGLWV